MNTANLKHLEAVKYESTLPHSCDWRTRLRPLATFALMIEGSGTFITSRKSFTLSPGDVVFIPNSVHYISRWQGNPNAYLSVHFMFDSEASQFEAQNFELQKITGYDFDATLSALEKIRTGLEIGGLQTLSATAEFYNFYSGLIPQLSLAEPFGAAVKSVQKAIDCLDNTNNAAIHVRQLANLCHLSESRFYTLFKAATGVSPIRYKNNVLIRRAIQMLKKGRTIQSVSDELGFSTASYFRKTFKLVTDKNPKEYMKGIYF